MEHDKPVRVVVIPDDSGVQLPPSLAAVLPSIVAGIERMLNDKELRAKVDRAYYEGRMADVSGCDWYMDHE